MFACAQEYPEYNAPLGKDRVRFRVTDLNGKESLSSKGERQHRDTIFSIKLEADVS